MERKAKRKKGAGEERGSTEEMAIRGLQGRCTLVESVRVGSCSLPLSTRCSGKPAMIKSSLFLHE